MGKKRTNKPTAKNGQPQVHQQKSFAALAGDLAITKLQPFIQQQVQVLGYRLQNEMNNTQRLLFTRLTTLEKLVQNLNNISDEEYRNLVADTEDSSEGLELVNSAAENGDTLRVSVSTKAKDQEEFAGNSMLKIDNLGNEPFSIGPELEPELIGMSAGDVKEVAFGKDKEMTAQLTVNRVSRRPAPPVAEAKEIKDENAGE